MLQNITRETIEKAAGGDMRSFEAIYRAASGFVYRTAYGMLNTKEDAEEAAQEVFLVIFRRLKTFRFEASLKTWIYRIAMNTSINILKKRLREKDKKTQWKSEMTREAFGENIKDRLDREQRENYLKSLLNCLNPDQRACMVLRCVNNLSYQDIADTLHVNINTVRTRLRRAREVIMRQKKQQKVPL